MIPYLSRLGIESVVNQPNAEFDIAYFVRSQGDPALEIARLQRKLGRPVIFDMVVNYLDVSGEVGGRYPVTSEHVEQCKRMLEVAHQVTCASTNIARRVSLEHHQVAYIPDSVDLRHFCLRKNENDFRRNRLRAVWSGASTKAQELEPILSIAERQGIELHLITDRPMYLKPSFWFRRQSTRAHFHQWTYETFPASIIQGDICVSYRDLSTPYNLGHSSFKVVVFMAQGVPAVVSPQPSYVEVVQDGVNGIVCNTMDDWQHAFERVSNDREELRSMSICSTKAVLPYASEKVAVHLSRLFQALYEGDNTGYLSFEAQSTS